MCALVVWPVPFSSPLSTTYTFCSSKSLLCTGLKSLTFATGKAQHVSSSKNLTKAYIISLWSSTLGMVQFPSKRIKNINTKGNASGIDWFCLVHSALSYLDSANQHTDPHRRSGNPSGGSAIHTHSFCLCILLSTRESLSNKIFKKYLYIFLIVNYALAGPLNQMGLSQTTGTQKQQVVLEIISTELYI